MTYNMYSILSEGLLGVTAGILIYDIVMLQYYRGGILLLILTAVLVLNRTSDSVAETVGIFFRCVQGGIFKCL